MVTQLEPPGFRQIEAKTFRPLNGHQCPSRTRLFFFLQEQFISGGRKLQAIEIEVHQLRCSLGVVLRQGKGGAGDWFGDPEAFGQALHQRCFAGPQGAAKQKN